ncbi:hypothetical protein [Autumnicola psychrophila]|uniref:Uncharacterized protein n=1 Tax=Autumnicola psychrophila TaxID=3075592 RepID=A0ABU3DQE0_9FLAO|nr:hypothetical protein [Zunongwangia sp. F225]MDT0685920.1 hypothetical protein [Zunongwangia sp. F225]
MTSTTACFAQELNLKVSGDKNQGFWVTIYDAEKPLLQNNGEFSMHLSNLDLSVQKEIRSWKASSYSQTSNGFHLDKDIYLPEFDANLSIWVDYEIINPQLIRKTVHLFQPSMPNLYYTLEVKNIPAKVPHRYVTFEHENFPGGLVHELYPSAGFITSKNKVVGFLTDPGYKNEFTRTTRRRFSGRGGGMIGMRILPDPNLLSVASRKEQLSGNNYIKYTFGEFYNLDRGNTSSLDLPANYKKEGKVSVSRNDSLIEISFDQPGKAGIQLITPFEDQQLYTISFLAKGDVPVALKLYRIQNGEIKEELEHGIKYIDNFPVTSDSLTQFKGSILLPYIENDSVMLFLGKTSENRGSLILRDLQLIEHKPFTQAYNNLPLGDTIVKTTYIFSEPWKDHKAYKIATQTKLAEGMGFKGTEIEKMLYANFQMMNWITGIDNLEPFNVPNLNYSPDMYNRDTFWSVISTHNKRLNLSIWNQWANTQTSRGAIGTIITPYMGSIEAKDNEATIEWLVWALLNKRRFNAELPAEKIKKAANYILNEFDPDKDGICESHFSMSQIDVMEYHPKTDRMAVNQGMFAVALKTIQALGIEIDSTYVQKAESEYVKFYDPKRKHLLFDRDYPDLITLTDLIPEFLSLWVFDHAMLTDEMVIHHLDQFPVLNRMEDAPYPEIGTTAPICIRLTKDAKGYSYMDADYQPFGEFGKINYADDSRDGFYYNGGSWLRAEYSAYVVGLKHGWEKAGKRMKNRLWAEMNLNPNWPYSKEFIPTKWSTYDDWWPSTRGLSWNVFVLMANEFANLRTPDMDPDYRKL